MRIDITDRFQIITADEGMVLTEWKEGGNILDYSYTTKCFSPLNYDASGLREITIEESDRLMAEQERMIKDI
jgi:hypothetical protein